jgi:predicted Zn-dependent protease with MMP-like domain
MHSLSDQDFRKLVSEAIDNIPPRYAKHIKNLAFVVEDEPTAKQRQRLKLNNGDTLFGLYEGVPLTNRSSGYNLVLPDKITIFKTPLEIASHDLRDLTEKVNHTVWHEVAHYYGLGHGRIGELEEKHDRDQ